MTKCIVAATLNAVIFFGCCVSAMAGEDFSREEKLLLWTVGDWAFTLGERSGERTIRVEFPSHLVYYSESFSGTDIRGSGFIGFSPEKNNFYSFAAHSIPGEFSLMHGSLDAKEDKIVYLPQDGNSKRPYEVVWQKVSEDQFSSTFYYLADDGQRERQWVAMFTRVTADD